MRWSEFADDAPRLAALGEQRLIDPGVVLVGTIRNDGTPRISPVEPLLWLGDLWLSMLLNSYKAADLKRDPRILIDIHDVTFIRYEEASGDQFVTRWPQTSEYVRRGTSATSLGDPEPYRDLLAEP